MYVYVPNVIGYARLLLVLASFYYANEENRPHGWGASVTVFAYVLSFICDELDGKVPEALEGGTLGTVTHQGVFHSLGIRKWWIYFIKVRIFALKFFQAN